MALLGASFYHLAYLTLGLGYCLGCLIIWVVRRDLGQHILVAGAFGAAWEAMSELCYLSDYWRPPTLLPWPKVNGHGWPLLEDLLYGFGVTGLTVAVLALYCGLRFAPMDRRTHSSSLEVLFFGSAYCVLLVLIVRKFSGANSVWMACLLFVLVGMFASRVRPNLVGFGLMTAGIMGLVAFVSYWLALNVIIDGDAYLREVWLPYHHWYNWRWLGVPADEVVWNITRGWAVSLLYVTFRRLTFKNPEVASAASA